MNPLSRLRPLSVAWIDRAVFVVVMLACLMAVSHHNADPDLWGHVRYGLDALESGLPNVNTYSYNAAEHSWINHENLAELAMALGLTRLGAPAMLWLKALMGLVVFAWMYSQSRRGGASQFATAIVVMLAAVNLMHHWVMRPQLYSYFFFACMIGFLGWVFKGWQGQSALPRRKAEGNWEIATVNWDASRSRWLWATPLLFLVWANTHGAFAAGLSIFAAYLGCRAVESFLLRREDAWRIAARHAAVIGLAFAATLLNPYGWGLHAWLLGSLGSPRPEITEWLSPELSYVWMPFWILVAVGTLAWALSSRRRDATESIILALVLAQAFAHRRHIAFLAILCGFWLSLTLESALARFRGAADSTTFGGGLPSRRRTSFGLVLALCALALGGNLFVQCRTITVKRDQYPVAAFQYMADHGLGGKLVTRFMWAQYAIYAFADDTRKETLRVAFDGRFRTCYPQDVVDMYFDFAIGSDGKWPRWRAEDSPPARADWILHRNSPDLALLDRKQKHAVDTLSRQGDAWTLLYQDQLAQLWGRTSVYGDPTRNGYIPLGRRHIGEMPQQGVVAWPAQPIRKHPSPFHSTRSVH